MNRRGWGEPSCAGAGFDVLDAGVGRMALGGGVMEWWSHGVMDWLQEALVLWPQKNAGRQGRNRIRNCPQMDAD